MTGGAPLESFLRRDRLIVASALAVLTVMAWAYILSLVRAIPTDMPMGGMDMNGMTMSGTSMPGVAMNGAAALSPRPWTANDVVFALTMWAVMMVGMMVPSAAPMILLYARVGRQAAAQGKPFAVTGFFAGGYLLVWTVFSLAATLGQWMLTRALLLTPMVESASGVFSGAVLIAAGLYQWTPLKNVCLIQCRAPIMCIHQNSGFKRDPFGSLVLGLRHGFYCVGCCWVLMALLFVGGVMNVLWIATIAVFVLAEKVLPGCRWLSRTAGVVLCAAGLWRAGAAMV